MAQRSVNWFNYHADNFFNQWGLGGCDTKFEGGREQGAYESSCRDTTRDAVKAVKACEVKGQIKSFKCQ